jgi:iron complex outermembrane receptor protein
MQNIAFHIDREPGAAFSQRIYVSEYNDDVNDVYGAYSECWVWESNITVSPWENVDIAFSVDNLFDEEYFSSSVGRERNFFMEISLKW